MLAAAGKMKNMAEVEPKVTAARKPRSSSGIQFRNVDFTQQEANRGQVAILHQMLQNFFDVHQKAVSVWQKKSKSK